MILVTGATGVVGTALLPELLQRGHVVRALVRDPRRLGAQRVNVQIALADLGDPHGLRHAMRGVQAVVHLGATIRDQPPRRLEEVNGLGTARLLRAAERAGVERFVFFSAIGATSFQRTRYFRSKALAERAVAESDLRSTIIAPSIVYDPHDHWISWLRRLALFPVLPISGGGQAPSQPIWAGDVARATAAALERDDGSERFELAGPETLTYEQMARIVAANAGRRRRVVHVPLPLVRTALIWLRRLWGETAFATWEEAELMEVPMTSDRGSTDTELLGVEPKRMGEVLDRSAIVAARKAAS
jgi:NADH dehydrogenase